jgi:hypothetical protein
MPSTDTSLSIHAKNYDLFTAANALMPCEVNSTLIDTTDIAESK